MFLKKYFNQKTVLVTGHTGFKGSWLSIWLHSLGSKVIGVSSDIPTNPSHFETANLKDKIKDIRLDVSNQSAFRDILTESRPDYIFHLAAQPLVRLSYNEPFETLFANAIGTTSVLDALRFVDKQTVVVMITSDKAYDNLEWTWGYRECDRLGGKDPYSASKGMAELAIRSYVESFFRGGDNHVRIGVGRAGNVIGGGDWALDRIVPDCIRSWADSKAVEIRNPFATRPWQHVLEPLSGYLSLAANLYNNAELHGEAFNFGPPAEQNHPVGNLVELMTHYWDQASWEDKSDEIKGPYESGLLKLNCDKALHMLNWKAVLNFEETVKETVTWYRNYYDNPNADIFNFTSDQIFRYIELAKERNLNWASSA